MAVIEKLLQKASDRSTRSRSNVRPPLRWRARFSSKPPSTYINEADRATCAACYPRRACSDEPVAQMNKGVSRLWGPVGQSAPCGETLPALSGADRRNPVQTHS